MWEVEEGLTFFTVRLLRDEQSAVAHSHYRESSGRYVVKLPCEVPTPVLGITALKRFLQKKGS